MKRSAIAFTALMAILPPWQTVKADDKDDATVASINAGYALGSASDIKSSATDVFNTTVANYSTAASAVESAFYKNQISQETYDACQALLCSASSSLSDAGTYKDEAYGDWAVGTGWYGGGNDLWNKKDYKNATFNYNEAYSYLNLCYYNYYMVSTISGDDAQGYINSVYGLLGG